MPNTKNICFPCDITATLPFSPPLACPVSKNFCVYILFNAAAKSKHGGGWFIVVYDFWQFDPEIRHRKVREMVIKNSFTYIFNCDRKENYAMMKIFKKEMLPHLEKLVCRMVIFNFQGCL